MWEKGVLNKGTVSAKAMKHSCYINIIMLGVFEECKEADAGGVK